MPSEIEVPLEKLQEDIHHAAHESSSGAHSEKSTGPFTFTLMGALLSAILAVFASIAALMSGHYADEAMLSQIKSSDQWSYYQAKGIKSSIAEVKVFFAPPAKAKAFESTMERYKKEQAEIKIKADGLQEEAFSQMHKHSVLAKSVTFFQVAIALTAIAVLARRREFLWVSFALGVVGVFFLGKGFF